MGQGFLFLEDTSPYCKVTDTPVFGLLVMSALDLKARLDPLLHTFLPVVIHKFTPGVTPADCIEVDSLASELFQSMHLRIICLQAMRAKPTTVRAVCSTAL